MFDLLMHIWLVDLIASLERILLILTFCLGCLIVFDVVCDILLNKPNSTNIPLHPPKHIKSTIKNIRIAFVVFLVASIIVPSKEAVYSMAGFLAADKHAHELIDDPTAQKATQLLNQKMDDLLH